MTILLCCVYGGTTGTLSGLLMTGRLRPRWWIVAGDLALGALTTWAVLR